MNGLQNDRGEWTIAIGAPGSIERMKVERPALLEMLNNLYWDCQDSPGHGIDIAIERIREAGIRSELETNSILMASEFRRENPGSVTHLVCACAGTNQTAFRDEYCKQLRLAYEAHPQDYTWPINELENVCLRMFSAIEAGTFSHGSSAMKATAKALHIRPTRKAILEFWKS